MHPETLARATAAALGLEIDEAWWPGVARHLGALMDRAATLEAVEADLPDDPAPDFRP